MTELLSGGEKIELKTGRLEDLIWQNPEVDGSYPLVFVWVDKLYSVVQAFVMAMVQAVVVVVVKQVVESW